MTLRSLHVLAAAAASLAGTAATAACPAQLPGGGGVRLESTRYELVYRAKPERIPLNEHFSVELAVCAKAGAPQPESVRVDAQMPEHKHGMNYKSSISAGANGYYRADGLMFHMPGKWQLMFDVRGAGRTDRMVSGVSVE